MSPLLTGWGRTAPTRADVVRPSSVEQVSDALASGRPVIARGLGRSYGDAAQNGGGLVVDATGRRPVLSEYSEEYLRALLAAIAGVVVVAYCIWAFDRSWATSASAVPFVMGIMRYGLLVDQGHGEEPELVLFGDRTLLGLAAACIGLLALGTAL